MTALAGWGNFYVIIGSSAGALIGLQFVVMTLIADMVAGRDAAQTGHAFATPTIVHFGTVLLLSGAMTAPWHGIASAALAFSAVGLVGIVYALLVVRRMRVQTLYQPEFEDWLFHAILPFVAYAMLAASAYAIRSYPSEALFAVAAAALLLLFVGIHNAWDGVTYHVFHKKEKQPEPEQRHQASRSE